MNILFLGPECLPLENCLTLEHRLTRVETEISFEWLHKQDFNFCISYRYKKILKREVLEYFGSNIINLHISYLPWNRGYDPNIWSFLEDTPKGVSIHVIDEGIDTGPILLQEYVDVNIAKDTLKTSWDRLSNAIESLFLKYHNEIISGAISPTSQKGVGSFHYAKDKISFQYLWKDLGWDTPVEALVGKSKKYLMPDRG